MAQWIPVVYKPLSIMEIPETVFNEDSSVGDLLTGSFWALPFPPGLNQAGYFKRKRKWYTVDRLPGQPLRLLQLKGARIKFKQDYGAIPNIIDCIIIDYMKITRTPNAENIDILPSRQTV